ncbi:dentin sialophosphoprotein-like [Argopecten irradians]|uniref:dentin sialophosphoprotein-like n=1 Tax=Argopecten irradians TaxID=31199 RepID=UPI00371A17DC
MALPPGSQSRDSMFDFFDDKADRTVDTGEHASSGEPEDKPVRQIVKDTEKLSDISIGTSGRQPTDISFRSIEEVIEQESNSTDTPEISKLDESNYVPDEVSLPGRRTGPPKVNQNSENTLDNLKFRSPIQRNVAPAEDDSLSVFSLLSNISLTENKSDQRAEKKLDSNIASQSEAKPATNKQDELDLFENIVDTNNDSSQEPSLDIERELSFSWLKSEPANRKSSPPIQREKSASPFKSQNKNIDFGLFDSDDDGDRYKTKAESVSVASDTRSQKEGNEDSVRKSSIPLVDNKSKDNMESDLHTAGTNETSNGGRADSMQDLSWLTGDKESRRKLTEPQKDREFSWLKTDTAVNGSESESKLGEQNTRETEPQNNSNVSWLQSNRNVKDSRMSEITNITSHSYEAADEIGLGLNKPSDMDVGANEGVDVTSHHSKEVDKLNLDPDKTIMDVNSNLKEGTEKVDSNPNDKANELKLNQTKTINELEADPNAATREENSEPSEGIRELDFSVSEERAQLDESNFNEAQKDVNSDHNVGMRELDIASSEPTAELDTRPNEIEKNEEFAPSAAGKDVNCVPNEGINEVDSDLNKSMEDLDFVWLKSKQETVKAGSISDLSLKSSQCVTPQLPTNKATTVAKHTVGWSEEKKDTALARSTSDKQVNGMCSSSDTPTPTENNATSHRGNDVSIGSVRNVPKEDDTSHDKSGGKEQDFLGQMNDLNFDFMAEEKVENKNDTPVVNRDATPSSLTASPASSKQNADLPSVDNNKTEFDMKQSQSNGSLTPSQNKSAGSSEVTDAIHSAVALFHDEKDPSNVVSSKSTKKQKKKTKRQNGFHQCADMQKKTANTHKKAMAINDRSEQKKETKPKVQNTKRQDIGKGKNSSGLNIGSKEKGKQKASKQKTDSESQRSKDDNGNSSKAVGNDNSAQSLESSDRLQSTTESSDTIIKIDDVLSHSFAYEDDFEDDARSVKSMSSSKSYLTSDSQRKGPPALTYSSTPYGSVYTAYERQTKHPVGNQNVRFPKINTLKPVQLTSGQSSFSEQSFSTVAKKKRKAKKNPPYSQDSYEFKAASDPDSKPEIILRKAGKVPVSLKAEAVYQKGRLEIAVVDERKRLSEDPNMDVRITVLHKHLDSFPFVKKRPKKLPKLNFATNRDILNHRAAYPPFNTYVDEQASERFKQTFGS